jgi:glycosyltransferase involved in cell wall biosynthesis
MKKKISKVLQKILAIFNLKITRVHQIVDNVVVNLKPDMQPVGSVLLSYVVEPFLLKPGQPVSNAHTHDWESLEIGRTFLEMGYDVDVISYLNKDFVPNKIYNIFIAARTNFDRIAKHLNADCLKIVHLDTAHWLYNNHAAYSRLLAVQRDKGVTIHGRRIVEANWAIENADCATILGNHFTIETYQYAKKPIYRVPISSTSIYPWNDEKDYQACKKRFLWFGGHCLVHKGLNLALEAFSEMPEYHLTVCGPVNETENFKRAYHDELFETPNIDTVGWVDVDSEKFMKIANGCIGVIYPSCSEGGGGSVITCMHAGLIPVVSYSASVDVDEFGVILKDLTVGEIKSAIEQLSSLETTEIRRRSRQAWEYARKNHTRENFAETFRKVIRTIIDNHAK